MNIMLKSQEGKLNENKNNMESYMDEVKKREEEKYKKSFNALENTLFEKACEMQEKAKLIEQYRSQIITMQLEIEQLQEEVNVINEEIEQRKIETEKISMSRKVIKAVGEFIVSIFYPKSGSAEIEEVKNAISDVKQSNLEEEKKERLYRVLNKLIKILNK